MTDQPIQRLTGDEVAALRFAARRQISRWSNKPELRSNQRAQRGALTRAARALQDKVFADGCELHVPSEGNVDA